jgi:hypothetical protein
MEGAGRRRGEQANIRRLRCPPPLPGSPRTRPPHLPLPPSHVAPNPASPGLPDLGLEGAEPGPLPPGREVQTPGLAEPAPRGR